MPDIFDRLKTALTDRYAIGQEVGSGEFVQPAVIARWFRFNPGGLGDAPVSTRMRDVTRSLRSAFTLETNIPPLP